jgi:transcriptional regulator GlxA family with amidase domain
MKSVCFLIPAGILKPASLFSALEVFEKANEFCLAQSKKNFYDMKIAGSSLNQTLLNGNLSIQISDIRKLQRPALIIIPGLHEQTDCLSEHNRLMIDWIIKQYNKGSELASLCTGSFLLAATGLLANKECSTHWKAEPYFRKMFPEVNLQVHKIITDSKGIYTAGGSTSSLNLMLYLVEKYNGREAALYCAKVLQIDIERNSQACFIIFEGQKNHDDDQIKKVQYFIEKNIEEKLSVELLADKFSISRRSLVRRFKRATNNSPVEYIQRIRMEVAKRKLERNERTVNEIMYAVGYTDIKAFRTIFRKVTGMSPTSYRNKYNPAHKEPIKSSR